VAMDILIRCALDDLSSTGDVPLYPSPIRCSASPISKNHPINDSKSKGLNPASKASDLAQYLRPCHEMSSTVVR
jgi:hypothetical protein